MPEDASAASPRPGRVMLKLSGEALQGRGGTGIDPVVVGRIADELVEAARTGVEIAVVVGGGNLWRGAEAARFGMDRASADHAGMLATVMNALVLQDALEQRGQHTRVASAIGMDEVAEPFIRRRCIRHLEKKRVVIFAAGIGAPYFTTDTAAALRSVEIDAEVMFKATQVDGIYTADPKTDPSAERLESIPHREAIERGLRVMDVTAISLAMENRLPVCVFDLSTPGNVTKALIGEPIGSRITTEAQEPPP
jgi:uridylate kinase